jgi:hypothetical protein
VNRAADRKGLLYLCKNLNKCATSRGGRVREVVIVAKEDIVDKGAMEFSL